MGHSSHAGRAHEGSTKEPRHKIDETGEDQIPMETCSLYHVLLRLAQDKARGEERVKNMIRFCGRYADLLLSIWNEQTHILLLFQRIVAYKRLFCLFCMLVL